MPLKGLLLDLTDWRSQRARRDTIKLSCCDVLPCNSLDQSSVFQNLPESCLVHILQHVPQKQRLQCCALVSTSWRAAAAAATTSIHCSLVQAQQAQQLMCWVSTECAQHITSLHASVTAGCHSVVVALPAPQVLLPSLQQLQLSGLSLSLTACSDGVSWLQASPALTQLRLCSCTLSPGLQSLAALAQLPDLQLLQLGVHRLLTAASLHSDSGLPCSMWARLTRLTQLDMSAQSFVTDAVLQELSCLKGLQELRLRAARLTTRAFSCLLPLQQLSTLQLTHAQAVRFSCSSTPALVQLPKLQHLSIHRWQELDPSLLININALAHLELDANRRASTVAEASALLAALSQLTALTALKLSAMLWYAGPASDAAQAAAAACGGITASSRLHTLSLRQCTLPMGAWQQVFPATRHMAALRQLVLASTSPTISTSCLQRIVQCCPGLQSLVLTSVLQPGAGLTPLLQLTGLTALEVGRGAADAETDAEAAMLTGLQHLLPSSAAAQAVNV